MTKNEMLEIILQEEGYLEKVKTCSETNLYLKRKDAGNDNYTKYWDIVDRTMQGQAWCLAFLVAMFHKCFGKSVAQKLMFMTSGYTYYTPTSANYFKNNSSWFNTPKVGDFVFFKNSTRIHHVGLVIDIDDKHIYTIEGNTKGGSNIVDANGGGVFKKEYLKTNPNIAGYGRPKYSLLDGEKYTPNTWYQDNKGWWYAKTEYEYAKNEWLTINKCKYYFDDKGYAVSGCWTINGKRYFFEDTKGAVKECALMRTNKMGCLEIDYC